jgi:hypothetical protein
VILDTRYEDLGGGKGWKMIRELGPHARTKLYAEGMRAFVAVREDNSDSWAYVYGKMSPYITFPIQKIYAAANEAEGIPADAMDKHGGSDIIGGSPRGSGSRISPEEMQALVNRVIDEYNSNILVTA